MVSRRSLFLGAAGLAAAVPFVTSGTASAADRANGANGQGQRVPRTLLRQRGRRAGGARFDTTSFKLSHLGITWTGVGASVRLRTAAGWSDWQVARGCPVGADTAEDAAGGSALIGAPDVIGYELAADGGEVASVELNTTDGPAFTTTTPAEQLALTDDMKQHPDVPRYLSRAGWGADESRRVVTKPDGSPNPLSFYTPLTITIHHEGNTYDTSRQLEHVRALYEFQTNSAALGGSGLDDLGYHLLIDTEGTVYEGRWSGNDRIPVFGDPFDRSAPREVNGAHLPGFNAGNIGVVLLGDYTNTAPAEAVYQSLAFVVAGLAKVAQLDPIGTTSYVNPADVADTTRTVPPRSATIRTVSGHRDWRVANPAADDTVCPGDAFYPSLDRIRQDAADLLPRLGPSTS